jgi:RNA polymerase sigma factor (sigma-70 family)
MEGRDLLATRFEEHRAHLRSVAHRMLGTFGEADDAVQETWLRLDRTDTGDVTNLGGWLTRVLARVCLDMLRARAARGEVLRRLPDPTVSEPGSGDPEREALLADSVGFAVLVVLETLAPAERVAFVLHDVFAVPFDEIAAILGRSPAASRQLASRARRRVRQTEIDADQGTQRQVVEAFLAAARDGDLAALVELLDPDVVVRADSGRPPVRVLRGSTAVAAKALAFAGAASDARLALVDGSIGLVASAHGRPSTVMGFALRRGRIVEIDILTDPERIRRLAAAVAPPPTAAARRPPSAWRG